MDTSHFSTFFPVACAGFGLLVAGGANLLVLRRGFIARALATFLGAGVGFGAAAALDQPGATTATAKLLGIGLAACLLLGWGGLVERLAKAVASLRLPAVRFAVLSACGVGTITGGMVYFQRADEKALDESMVFLDAVHARVESVPSAKEKATTDQGTAVVLREAVSQDESGRLTFEEQILKDQQLSDQVIRRGPASDRANCHGWVFTGGQFHLSPDSVELILKENGYQEVQQPQPGDLVIYRNDAGIAHTAVARYVTEGQPVLVEGKWGTLGIFLHPADKSPYGTEYTFYRSGRSGHLLAGVGGPKNAASASPASITD